MFGGYFQMKMRVLTATKKGKLLALAAKVAEKAQSEYKVDIIPPAYQCDRERLVVIVASVSPKMGDAFDRFVMSLSRAYAQNVAFIADGKPEDVAKIVETVKAAGANVVDEVLYITGGLPFKFMKKYTAEEETAVLEWTDRVLAAIK